MRASPRKRSVLAAVGLLALGAGLWAGAALSSGSVGARAVAAAKQVVVRSQARAQAVNQAAVPTAPGSKPAPAKAVVPAQRVPAAAVAPAKAGTSTVRAPRGAKPAPPTPARPPAGAVVASMRPGVRPVPAPSPAARLDDQVTYQYNALGRRDPFLPLVGGVEYAPIEAPPDVGAIRVVGIVWGSEDKFAIVEDGRGSSSVLRPGDKVMNGVVQSLKRDGVVVELTADGQTQSVTIPLTRKGDSNANR